MCTEPAVLLDSQLVVFKQHYCNGETGTGMYGETNLHRAAWLKNNKHLLKIQNETQKSPDSFT